MECKPQLGCTGSACTQSQLLLRQDEDHTRLHNLTLITDQYEYNWLTTSKHNQTGGTPKAKKHTAQHAHMKTSSYNTTRCKPSSEMPESRTASCSVCADALVQALWSWGLCTTRQAHTQHAAALYAVVRMWSCQHLQCTLLVVHDYKYSGANAGG
jgi:hypothetical protein